jgi:hypothetical protein
MVFLKIPALGFCAIIPPPPPPPFNTAKTAAFF